MQDGYCLEGDSGEREVPNGNVMARECELDPKKDPREVEKGSKRIRGWT